MPRLRRTVAFAVSGLILVGTAAGCSDDPGEDEIGDEEIIDEGD